MTGTRPDPREDRTVTDPETSTGQSDLRSMLGHLAGADPDTEAATFAADIAERAQWARDRNDGHPTTVWSAGEQLAAALVLEDFEHITAMGWTVPDAVERVAGGMYFPPADMDAWLAGIRAQLTD